MAKKKNSSKKHKFKHAEQSPAVQSAEQTVAPAQGAQVLAPAAKATTSTRDFSYVAHDLRRIGLLAGALVALELVLAYLVSNTGVGPTVYRLIQF